VVAFCVAMPAPDAATVIVPVPNAPSALAFTRTTPFNFTPPFNVLADPRWSTALPVVPLVMISSLAAVMAELILALRAPVPVPMLIVGVAPLSVSAPPLRITPLFAPVLPLSSNVIPAAVCVPLTVTV
jgi:hypothetical protein